jgi:hypothetical protein
MKALMRLLLVLALGALPYGGAWAKTPRKSPKGPVVVELFTAQGCASCKQANGLIAKIAVRPGVIALMWSVDYWDYLGWKDTFAQPEFTLRQKAYERHLGPTDVYTPQVVVNGVSQVSGDDAAGVEAMIRDAELPRVDRPRITFLGNGRVKISAVRQLVGRADIWLVRYNPREQDVEVKAGDNRGATVIHRDAVQRIVRLGVWTGHAVTLALPPAAPDEDLASAVLVQRSRGGPILGAAETRAR